MSYRPVGVMVPPTPSLPPTASLRGLDVDALDAEDAVEAAHERAVDAQMAGDASSAAAADVEEGEVTAAENPTTGPSGETPLPSPLASEVARPSEMSAEELKAHMADVSARVSRDVAEMEHQRAAAPALQVPGQIVIMPGRHDRLVRTVFGFTVYCKCTINDEVRMTVWILLIIGVLCGLGFFIADVSSSSFDFSAFASMEHGIAVGVGGLFSFLACVLSYIQIKAHYAHWVHPPSQRCVVRILLMVPVYSISAWLSLTFIKYSLYIDFIRMCYEAFVIYTFMILLTKYLGGHNGVVEWMKTNPMCCIPPVRPGSTFLYWLKYGTLQYTIISPIISVIAMVLNFFGFYGDGEFQADHGYVYISFVQNCTQLISLYCLVWLYVAMKNELAPFSPMAKFLVVKSVVFFTFWQSVGLAVLVKASVITASGGLDVGSIQIGLQDFIVCIEMFIAAAVHKYTFGWETYANGTMKLLMDQRAMYLAEMSYKRAQEEQKREEERLLKEERKRMGLDTEDEEEMDKGEGEPLKKARRKRRRKGKARRSVRVVDIDTSRPPVAGGAEVAIDIFPGPKLPLTPVLEPELFTGDQQDDALVDDEELSRSQRQRRDLFKAPPSLTLHSPRTPTAVSSSSSSSASTSVAAHPPFLAHTRRNSAGQSALNLLEGGARGLIGSARSVLLPVSSFFVNDDDDALFDEEADGKKPILLTQDMRREIEERVRREAADKEERKKQRKDSGGEGAELAGAHSKRRSGEYDHLSTDDHDDAGVEMQETKEREREREREREDSSSDDDGL